MTGQSQQNNFSLRSFEILGTYDLAFEEGESIEILQNEYCTDSLSDSEVDNQLADLLFKESKLLKDLEHKNNKLQKQVLALSKKVEKLNYEASETTVVRNEDTSNSRISGLTSSSIRADTLDKFNNSLLRTSILSFFSAFIVLTGTICIFKYWDLEYAKLERDKYIAEINTYEKSRQDNDNFRETLIHLKYEENRELQASLSRCYSKKEEFLMNLGVAESKAVQSTHEMKMKIFILEQDLKDERNMNKVLKEFNQKLSSRVKELENSPGGSLWSWLFKTKQALDHEGDFPDVLSGKYLTNI